MVVRGIYDYANSHKIKTWQPHAAATAAATAEAYAEKLLNVISGSQRRRTKGQRDDLGAGYWTVL
jgi:hypothetical protein